MATFQGKRVSSKWAIVLQAAWDDGVRFQLNSGQRTLAEQRRLYRLYKAGKGNLAAYPNPNAPHIRVGRSAHALDVDSYAYGDGENKLQTWLRKQGADARNTVPGESWHLEVSEKDLDRLYQKFNDPFRGYPADEKRWIREYDELKQANRDKDRRRVLRRVMTERRKEIWRAAQKDGWRKRVRVKRYASLRARTR